MAAALMALAAASCAHKAGTRGTDATHATAPSQQGNSAAPTTSTAAAPVSPWHAPAPGAYRYHYERTGADPASYDGPLTIARSKSAGVYAESRDHQSAKITRAYKSTATGAVQETSFTLTSAAGDNRCTWNKPVTFLPADPKPGKRWTAKASCTLKAGSGTTLLAFEETATVHGIVTATLDKTPVPVLRVDRTITLRSTAPDGKTDTRVSNVVDYFDTARGLLAQSTVDAKDNTATGATTYRIVETMLTVQPEVSR
jgi:hypothetical protein